MKTDGKGAEKLSVQDTEKLLRKYGIPFARTVPVKSVEDAVAAAGKLGYPVVLKVDSGNVMHKTDAGGVVTDIRTDQELAKAFRDIKKTVKRKVPGARIEGMLVQPMVDGREVIVGAKRDPQFGPVVMFGLGGIFVELMKDVSFRLLPIRRKEAAEMIREIKGYPALRGLRGQKPVKFSSLEKVILGVSRLMWDNGDIEEMDLNPVMASGQGAVAADARIIRSE